MGTFEVLKFLQIDILLHLRKSVLLTLFVVRGRRPGQKVVDIGRAVVRHQIYRRFLNPALDIFTGQEFEIVDALEGKVVALLERDEHIYEQSPSFEKAP